MNSIPIGGNLIFCWNFLKPSISMLYRNARFVLKMKTSSVLCWAIHLNSSHRQNVFFFLFSVHPVGTLVVSAFFEEIRKIWHVFYNGGIWETIFSIINKQSIYLKNNIAQLYFIQRTSEVHLNFSSTLKLAAILTEYLHTIWWGPTSCWKIMTTYDMLDLKHTYCISLSMNIQIELHSVCQDRDFALNKLPKCKWNL